MQTDAEKRLEYIDCAKGIGILLVVIAHHLQDSEGVLLWIYSFHMPLFFIITGYLLAKRNKRFSLKEAILSGAKSLMYPFYTFSVVLLLWWILLLFVLQAKPEESFRSMLLRMLTTYGYHALWFLPTMYIAGIVSKTYRFGKRWILLAGTVVAGCAFSYSIHSASLFDGTGRYIAMYCGRTFLAISFIEIGRILFNLDQRLNCSGKWITFFLSVVILFVLHKQNCLVSIAFSRIGNPLIFYMVACSGSIASLLLCERLAGTLVGKTLSFWGKNSLIVMAIHMDISIEIAWIALSITGIAERLSFRTASVFAILLEMVLLPCMIVAINRYGGFLIHLPIRKEK